MNYMGKPLPMLWSYQDGRLVWEYVLPDELEITEYGFQEKIETERVGEIGSEKPL